METEPRLKTSSDRLEKPAIESVITVFKISGIFTMPKRPDGLYYEHLEQNISYGTILAVIGFICPIISLEY